MLRAQDTMRAVLDLNQYPSPNRESARCEAIGSGHHRVCNTYGRRAAILISLVWADMAPEVVYPMRILIIIVSSYNCGVDTKQFLHNVLAEAICGYSFV